MVLKATMGSSLLLRAGLVTLLFQVLWFSPVAAAPPNLIPHGWTKAATSARDTIQFMSPNHRATLTMRDIRTAAASPVVVVQPRSGETVTYRKRGLTWSVLSGYRGDDIFYRRADLACKGRRIHQIELIYPRGEKRQLDATVTSISRHLVSYRNVCRRR
jgi:hypothetical protein